jgi:hypothetical protein
MQQIRHISLLLYTSCKAHVYTVLHSKKDTCLLFYTAYKTHVCTILHSKTGTCLYYFTIIALSLISFTERWDPYHCCDRFSPPPIATDALHVEHPHLRWSPSKIAAVKAERNGKRSGARYAATWSSSYLCSLRCKIRMPYVMWGPRLSVCLWLSFSD